MRKILTLTLMLLACACFSIFAVSCANSKTFKVAFDLDGGVRVGGGAIVQEVESADQIVAPTVEKEGYTFVSWNIPLLEITEDTSVKAVWEKNKITVTFSVMGGEYKEGSGALTQTVKEAGDLILPEFTRKGYTLSWDKKVSDIVSSCSVIGVWIPNEYKVTFLDEKGVLLGGVPSIDVRFDQNVRGLPTLSDEEKKFVGWKLPSGYMLTEGMTWNIDQDTEVVAVWTNYIKYAINYDLDGGSSLGLPAVYVGGKGCTLPSPTKIGYSFVGWTECSAAGEEIGSVMPSVTIDKDATGDKYYKANWAPNEYKINFVNDDGTPVDGVESLSVYYDQAIPTLPVLYSEGKKFVGWQLSSGAMLISASVWNYEEDKTVKAVWAEKGEYLIVIDFCGGEELSYPATYKEGTSLAIGGTTKKGHVFLGWVPTDEFGNEIGTLVSQININETDSGDKYYKAKWQAIVCQIIFCDEDNVELSGIDRIFVAYGEKVPTLPTLTSDSKKFVGWKLSSGENLVSRQVWNFAESQRVVCSWVAYGKYNISIDLDGGNQIQYPSTYIEGKGAVINGATRTGYTFLGWVELDAYGNVISEAKPVVIISNTDIGDKFYRATWQVKTFTVYFVSNNGTPSLEMMEFTYGQKVENLPTVSGHEGTFDCWVYNGQEVREGMTWTIEESGIELSAKFVRKFIFTLQTETKVGTKSVSVKLPEGTPNVIELTENQVITLPTAVAEDKDEYTFRGWRYVNLSGKQVKLESNTVITPAAFPDLDLEGIWTVEITLIPYCTANWSGYY